MVVKSSSVPVRLRKTVSMPWLANWDSSHAGSWMEPLRAVILGDEGIEALRREALLVVDWISRGTSSVPMLPEAEVIKTLDMMFFLH